MIYFYVSIIMFFEQFVSKVRCRLANISYQDICILRVDTVIVFYYEGLAI